MGHSMQAEAAAIANTAATFVNGQPISRTRERVFDRDMASEALRQAIFIFNGQIKSKLRGSRSWYHGLRTQPAHGSRSIPDANYPVTWQLAQLSISRCFASCLWIVVSPLMSGSIAGTSGVGVPRIFSNSHAPRATG